MNYRNQVVKGFWWRFLERIGAQGVTFAVSIVLARILDPDTYGVVALITVFTTIMQVFIDAGLGSALIQKKDADDTDFSSVFFFNLGMCIVLYGIMFLCAPLIAELYERPYMTPMIRVLSLVLIISGIKNVQQAYVSRNLLFKKFFFSTLGGTIGAAIIGVWMALAGFGVWALIAQNLFNVTLDTIILWITVKWRPQRRFSFHRLKSLLIYGWKLLASALLDVGYHSISQLLIGKKYTSSDLAYYNRGNQFPSLIVSNVNTSMDSVLFPAMSSLQDDKEKVLEITRRAIKTSTFVMMPLMMGLAVCAEPLIRIVLTEKWLPSVFYLRIFCFSYSFWAVHTSNLNALKALGRSDLFLRLEVIKKVIAFTALISTVFISVKAMAISILFTSVTSQIINSWPNRKLLNYSYIMQLKDMIPQIIISCIMGVFVFSISLIGLNDIITLAIQIPLGVIIYIGLSYFFKVDSFVYMLQIVKNIKEKGKQNE